MELITLGTVNKPEVLYLFPHPYSHGMTLHGIYSLAKLLQDGEAQASPKNV
jgi:hypothetical protein